MSWLSNGLKKIEKGIASKIPHTTAADRRSAMQASKEQIDYYQKAKEELVNARNDADEQKKMERQKINEKEIRGRKRQYNRGGFLTEPSASPVETLG